MPCCADVMNEMCSDKFWRRCLYTLYTVLHVSICTQSCEEIQILTLKSSRVPNQSAHLRLLALQTMLFRLHAVGCSQDLIEVRQFSNAISKWPNDKHSQNIGVEPAKPKELLVLWRHNHKSDTD